MTKIDVISGFLGAGKTTLLKKLLKDALKDEQVVLIENEFGEIGIDGGFLKEAGIEIKEMNSGCICCSLVGDFGTSLREVLDKYHPQRIMIEPSGVGKLSDVLKAVQNAELTDVELNSAIAVVDATKCKMYIKNFGEFFVNQVENAGTIVLSRTDKMPEDKLKEAVALLREHNAKATIVTTPWDQIDGRMILETMEGGKDLAAELMAEVARQQEEEHEHHHDHHHEEEEHEHHHDHHHEEEEHEHHHDHHHEEEEHEHHHDDGECVCGCHKEEHDHHHEEEHDHHHEEEHDHHHEEGHEHHHHEEHEHHHEHDENCTCGCHDHEHHHHHHADEVFGSWGMETPAKYTAEDIENILKELDNEEKYGIVLRAKGMVPSTDGGWIYFDYVPQESNVRTGQPQPTGRFCVIGSKLQEKNLEILFTR